jgi:hypothetical protein
VGDGLSHAQHPQVISALLWVDENTKRSEKLVPRCLWITPENAMPSRILSYEKHGARFPCHYTLVRTAIIAFKPNFSDGLLADTGLRPDECHRLRWEDISLDEWAQRHFARDPREDCSRKASSEGWLWPAPTKTGHIDHSSLKKQHYKTLRWLECGPLCCTAFGTRS